MDGVAVGSLYALIALGYTMVYGILKFINFAHSDVFVLGAWLSFVAAGVVGLNPSGPGAVGVWVFWVLAVITATGGLAALYELAIRPRAGAMSRLPATRLTGPLMLVAAWGWGCLGLLYITKGVNAAGLHTLAGGMILVLS